MTKRLLCSLCTLVMVFGALMCVNTKAATVYGYDVDKALEYAQKNWNSGVGLCAEYASKCLQAGGVDVSATRVCTLYDELLEKDCGKLYKLKLTNGKSGSVKISDNKGKVEAGDPIFYYCNICGTFEHVVISNGANDSGYVRDYAHNSAHNGKKQTYTFSHCGGESWTLYSIRMYNGATLYGDENGVEVPVVTSLENAESGVKIQWNKTDGAVFYNVYRKVDGSSWQYLKSVKTTAFTDTSVQNGTDYVYTVRAYDGKVLSRFYGGTHIKYLSQVDFKSVSNTANGVYLKWNVNNKASGYKIYRQTNSGKWEFLATVKNAGTSAFTDKKVTSGNTYCYRIRAYSGSALSGYDTNGKKTMFLGKVDLTSAVNTKEGIKVSWNRVTGAAAYKVYRKSGKDSTWSLVATVNTNSYTDQIVMGGTVYKYTVKAVSGAYAGSYDANGISVSCLVTPEIGTLKGTSDGVALNWGSVDSAFNYSLRKVSTANGKFNTQTNSKVNSVYTAALRGSGKSNSQGKFEKTDK